MKIIGIEKIVIVKHFQKNYEKIMKKKESNFKLILPRL